MACPALRRAKSLITPKRGSLSYELSLLTPVSKKIQTANLELRWIRQHVEQNFESNWQKEVVKICRRRRMGIPLQYVLGSQPFGRLDIKCKKGVFIPRPDTESQLHHLSKVIPQTLLPRTPNMSGSKVRILDICTGTGCIPLHLLSSLHPTPSVAHAVDISPRAISLAKENAERNSDYLLPNSFFLHHLDLFSSQADALFKGPRRLISDELELDTSLGSWDVITANPPYISLGEYYSRKTDSSVRKWEPSLALVPELHAPRPKDLRWPIIPRVPIKTIKTATMLGSKRAGSKTRRCRRGGRGRGGRGLESERTRDRARILARVNGYPSSLTPQESTTPPILLTKPNPRAEMNLAAPKAPKNILDDPSVPRTLLGLRMPEHVQLGHEDIFYARIIQLAAFLDQPPPRMLWMEVGDMEQAERVASLALSSCSSILTKLEIWRDCPDMQPRDLEHNWVNIGEHSHIPVIGSGNARAVFIVFDRAKWDLLKRRQTIRKSTPDRIQ